MSTPMRVAGIAVALGFCAPLQASTTLTLNCGDICYDPGDTIAVTVDMTDATTNAVGGQLFLEYDKEVLGFVAMVTGDPPFTREIYEIVDSNVGTIDYAIGTPDGDQSGTSADSILATITFTALAGVQACSIAELVGFRTHAPPTMLANPTAEPIVPLMLVDLGPISIDDVDPVISSCPPHINTNADPGGTTAYVTVPSLGVGDNCGVGSVVNSFNGSDDASGTYPAGVTTVTWTVTDECGNEADCVHTVTVSDFNVMLVSVELSPVVESPLTRCITFELIDEDDCPAAPVVVEQEIAFTYGLAMDVPVLIPAGVDYSCVTARDRLHTLRRTDESFHIEGTEYVADFTGNVASGGDWLVGGNFNDDEYIDILDFGVYILEWATNYGSGNTTCGTAYPHGDVSGDGLVSNPDFSFLQINFLEFGEPDCCGALLTSAGGQDGPITEITVVELSRLGMSQLVPADLNADGWLDVDDIAAFMQGVRPSSRPQKRWLGFSRSVLNVSNPNELRDFAELE
ncbi:MAG: HYR domain-containing protein [Phycisphaerae bacterium]|nr:HYR domain-containing protein [Phycisphaerae bacterium]